MSRFKDKVVEFDNRYLQSRAVHYFVAALYAFTLLLTVYYLATGMSSPLLSLLVLAIFSWLLLEKVSYIRGLKAQEKAIKEKR